MKKMNRGELALIAFIFVVVAGFLVQYFMHQSEKKQLVFEGQAIISAEAVFYPGEDYPVESPTIIVEVDTGGDYSIPVRIIEPCAIKDLLYHRAFSPEKNLFLGRPGDIFLSQDNEWLYEGQLVYPAN